ncbi:hypothetical protein [Streptomyces canus]|uniref:hypothetical protein n=1 Tax=Streptomyces canus TaxID=58343 RepID=UPI0038654BB2
MSRLSLGICSARACQARLTVWAEPRPFRDRSRRSDDRHDRPRPARHTASWPRPSGCRRRRNRLHVPSGGADGAGNVRQAHEALGITPARYRLSPGPECQVRCCIEKWQRSTALPTDVLDHVGLPYDPAEGEAAFYGPKTDVPGHRRCRPGVHPVHRPGRFHQPEQFDLHYISADGASHRPVMIHRSIIGSVERVVAHLIERHGGAFPA